MSAIPPYLEQHYWWAYVHPRAVQIFEREWLVNLILFGNYDRLSDQAVQALGQPITGSTLQIACAYGDLTQKLIERMSPQAELEIVDILPIQLDNLARKIGSDARVTLRSGDSASLPYANATHDQALLFFLLHEQPDAARRATLREALRVVRPGGRVVIVDYHRPRRWHPLRFLMRYVFGWLEPFAMDLWDHDIDAFMPTDIPVRHIRRIQFFGDLYQLLIVER